MKNYELYPSYQRKIDNWRKRIIGYEKMKRDLSRQNKKLYNENKKLHNLIEKLKVSEINYRNLVSYYEEQRRECEYDSFYVDSYQTTIHKLNAKRELIKDILNELDVK